MVVPWTTKLVNWVRSLVAAGLPTGYSVLGGNTTRYCYQHYWPRLDNGGNNQGGNDMHHGLYWK